MQFWENVTFYTILFCAERFPKVTLKPGKYVVFKNFFRRKHLRNLMKG